MNTLDQEQDVVDLARKLGLRGSPVEAIIRHCQKQIDAWVKKNGGVSTVEELEALVASRLNLVFEEVNEDADLDELKYRYAKKGEFVFATLKDDLTPDTYGTMIRLKDSSYVAVIDCRGNKAARRFFTRWHEIAHLLVDENVEKQVFRSTDEPLERLMDQIAGHVGFYDSIFTPLFKLHVPNGDLLTFEIVDTLRKSFCSYASFQSTLFACRRRLTTPILYLEASMEYSVSERRGLKQRRMIDFDPPQKKLRVQMSLPNDAAAEISLTARWNMRVPESSIVFAAYQNEQGADVSGEENLRTWTFSSGGSLMDCNVVIQARRIEKSVMAIIQPTG